ncbi:MAG: cysteine hydrolase [Magnetococcales bacterium]|nr:cysteine hydrolase [Magnetococcales bacterium]
MSISQRRALIVIDVQNEYVTGNLVIEYPDLGTSLRNIERIAKAAQQAGIPVIVVRHNAPEDAPIFAKGSAGWQLHPIAARLDAAHFIDKRHPSVFAGTDLRDWLQSHKIDIISLVGFMTHNCLDATSREAFHEGWQVEFIHDATGSVSYANRVGQVSAEEIHKAFIVVQQARFAAVLDTDEWIDNLASGHQPERDDIFHSYQNYQKYHNQGT